MAKVITFSRTFPTYHPKKGQPTYFVEKFLLSKYGEHTSEPYEEILWNANNGNDENRITDFFFSLNWEDMEMEFKHHTIRAGSRFKAGDYFSPRVWSGKPYNSPQIKIAPDTLIVKTWDFEINNGEYKINDRSYFTETESTFETLEKLSSNDGLTRYDLLDWFQYPKPFKGQIICWNDSINY